MGPSQTGTLDASVKKQAYAFLEKLSENDALPGLHIEPILGSADDRVRTGRVNDFYRAILFKVQGQGDSAHYVYLGVLAHDDAIAFAKKARLAVNPVNGIAELIIASEEPSAAAAAPAAAHVADAATAAPSQPPLLPAFGLDETALVAHLGIDSGLALAALAATTEDEILALAENAVQWQGLALLDLASGTSLADVKAGLGIAAEAELVAAVSHADEDDRILAALQHPAAKMQFAFIEDNEELRRAIEDVDFAAWRVFLHPEQRKYATTTYSGPFRLSGGAGTGKTVVLLHRAQHLARTNPQARLLLTTFTTTLADALKADFRRLDPTLKLAANLGDVGVYISGIDAAVSSVLRKHKSDLAIDIETVLGSRSADIAGRTSDSVWQDASGVATDDLPAELQSKAFLTAEYAMVVLPARITNRDDYLTARRPGRGVALDRKKRIAVWQVIEAYRARAGVEGSIDFAEAASIATASLERRATTGSFLADHVLVDEGQDLNPSHWQFLRSLVASGTNDLFLAEDSHQRIYGQKVVLSRYGIRIVGRSQRLKLNYRTTAQNLHFAIGVLDGTSYADLEDAPEDSSHYRSARSGPPPQRFECSSLTGELDTSAETVKGWLASGTLPETIGILVRDSQQAGLISRGLEERGVDVRVIDTAALRLGRPLVMTMHRAKGMEFACVLLFGVNDGMMPAGYLLKDLAEADRADAIGRERSLLYVAATRARDELVITTSGQPSDFLPGG